MNWGLLVCGLRGHATFVPDEPELADRLRTDTAAGDAWRCLRCEAFVTGPPKLSGPADSAPEILRGTLLRDLVITRVLAVDRGVRALLIVVVGILVIRFVNYRTNLQAAFDTDLPLLQPLEEQLRWNVSDSPVIRLIHDVFSLSPSVLNLVTLGLFGYAVLLGIEAVGLWLMRRWGEYFSVVATSVFLPLEVYELSERVTALKLIALVINIAAVLWLVWSKRLFGVRGGDAAYREEHAGASLLSVERASLPAPER